MAFDSQADKPSPPALLPVPAQVTIGADTLGVAAWVQAEFSGSHSERMSRAVGRFEKGLQRLVAGKWAANGAGEPLRLRISRDAASDEYPQLGDAEGYRLSVGVDGVRISADCDWGVVHALSTLLQLVTVSADAPSEVKGAKGPCELPYCQIEDAPRFAWRGVLIDVARHFIGLDALLRTLDGMALCKLNVLHLHLTDDQAFRFPSKRFPGLASDEHFTISELGQLVEYAADRAVRVVPEFDVPGHTNSWLVAHPEWGTDVTQATRSFGVHQACLDPSNDAVYGALETLLTEVAGVFPDHHLHIGGDEVHPAWWTASPAVQSFMVRHSIADVAALQAYFVSRVAAIVTRLGRTAVGWDEVLHPDLPDSMVVQSWRGATARDRALARGNDCVVSSHYYLDLYYPAEIHYRFDPEADEATLVALENELLEDPRFAHVADGMRWTHQWREYPTEQRGNPGSVIGAEACLWSELVAEPLLDVRLWSRLPALAERFWSPAVVVDVDDLYRRLSFCYSRLALSAIDIEAGSRSLTAAAGVTETWWPLVEILEPVKWYGRLLGEIALAARIRGTEMPQARPYNADTPLNRVVDALLPESPVARAVADLCRRHLAGENAAAGELARFARSWQALAGLPDCLPELAESARVVAQVGAAVIGILDGHMDRESVLRVLNAAAEPQGEYVVAVVPALRFWVEASAP